MDCETCREMNQKPEPVTYLAFESMKATMERTIKRLWVLALVLIVLLFGTNAAWLYYESQWEVYETVVEAEQTTEGGGNNYAVGGDIYGSAES